MLRSLGAQVSWDAYAFPGATFDEKDTTVTHHIVDRPLVANKILNRFVEALFRRHFGGAEESVMSEIREYFRMLFAFFSHFPGTISSPNGYSIV